MSSLAPRVLLVVEHVTAVCTLGALPIFLLLSGPALEGLHREHIAPCPLGVFPQAKAQGIHVRLVAVVLGDLVFGVVHVRVHVVQGV